MRAKTKIKFATIDCETDPFLFGRVPEPFIWGYYDGVEFHSFRETKKFIAFISTKKISAYAHNGGRFDVMMLLSAINSFEKILIINNRISKCRVGKCTLLDSYNLLPMALGNYKKDDIDYSKFESAVRENHMSEITEYLRNDCVYLHELVSAYREKFGADVTQASGAMKTYQKMSGKKVPRHNDKITFGEIKQFYFGGRVECFETGIIEKPFSVVDINSAYPFAMTYAHPFGLEFVRGKRAMPFRERVRMFYHLSCISNGALPYKERHNAPLSFPSDDTAREYRVSDWEYHTAMNAGLLRDVKIIETLEFTDTTDFSDYVNHFYAERKKSKLEGDELNATLCKFRLNSLYGKFGSDFRKYKNHIVLPKDFENSEYENVGNFGDANSLFASAIPESDMNFYNVATAASVTGFVRAYLLAAMVNVGFENLLYCDTDSIAAADITKIKCGGALGQWKHEGDFFRAGIAGKKLYIFEGENGATKKASKGAKLSDAELWRVCDGETVEHFNHAPSFSITGKVSFVKRNIKITKNKPLK